MSQIVFSPDCSFNPKIDRSEVDQFGFLDLCDAYANGSVPGSVDFSSSEYNEMTPDDVLSRPDDKFAAMRQRSYVQSTLKAAKESAAAAAAAAE